MSRERHITAFLHAKGCTVVMIILACMSCVFAWERGAVVQMSGNMGFGVPSANQWIVFGRDSAAVSIVVNIIVALLAVNINRTFNVLRSPTWLMATMFLTMQMALPPVFGQFYGGTMLVLLSMLLVLLLFSVFGDQAGQRRVFLAFFILGGAAFTQVAYLFYVPVVLLGCVQMRIFSLRTFLAAMLGLVTPAWILLGFGIVVPDSLSWPGMVAVWSLFDARDMAQSLVATGITVITGIVFMAANVLRILKYNARARAYNGFLMMLFIFTILFILINFNNFTFYIPLLNCLAAYQVGHFFACRRQRRSYIAVFLIVAVYVSLYVWAVA